MGHHVLKNFAQTGRMHRNKKVNSKNILLYMVQIGLFNIYMSKLVDLGMLAPGRNSHFGCNRNRQFELR